MAETTCELKEKILAEVEKEVRKRLDRIGHGPLRLFRLRRLLRILKRASDNAQH